ncbi:MAG TPA: VWA domain-containing protein [Bryobacteraceae bacterium]|nr:VWA domain-containing protein [Bryobacteraceae bacterium]
MRYFSALLLTVSLLAQDLKFEASSQLVVVNVTVKGKDGKPVSGLKQNDFHVFEDGKPVQVSVFEHQDLNRDVLPPAPIPKPAALPPPPSPLEEATAPRPSYRDKRLLVLFFDFTSLPQLDLIRAREAAAEFLAKQMTVSDLVAVYTFANKLRKVTAFTDDRDLLLRTVQSFGVASGVELDAAAADVVENVTEDDGSLVTDETEFAIFNTDQKLGALEDISKELASIPEKKAVVYFSSGVAKNGMDNQSQLQAAVNAAVRGGVSLYPIDVRGLIAMAPAGGASQGAPRGTAIFSGSQQRAARDRVNDQQETLFTLAEDTGGRALLDSNNLTLGIQNAQKDVESYYTLAYYATNSAKDGRFRKIKVELAGRKDVKLDYRPGYYSDKVWNQFDSSDKEKQLSEAMGLGNPVTELPLAVELLYFRLDKGRYFVPLAVKIPGSKIGVKSGKTDLDFAGTVKDAKGRTVATLRDGIKVKLPEGAADKLAQRSLLYDAGFQLTPGKYTIKVLARENQEGKLGTFEAKFTVPDLDQGGAAPVSSLVLGTGRETLAGLVGNASKPKKKGELNPLVQDGKKLAPSVTHVFRRPQTLTVFGETYTPGATARVALFRDKKPVWQSAPLRPAPAGREGVFAWETGVKLAALAPGEYVCQLTVVDAAGQRFEVRRAPLSIVP